MAVQTDLQVTGRHSQLGRGIIEEVASGVLDEFAARLARLIVGDDERDETSSDHAFDAGCAVLAPLLERAAILLAGVLFGFGLGRATRHR